MNPVIRRALGPLEPILLPIWNGGHRVAWRLGEILEALGHRRFERCACCGRWGPMLRRPWVIGPELVRRWALTPTQAEALVRKETDACAWCGAPRRCRRLAQVLLELFPAGTPPARSLRGWSRTPEARGLRVAEINEVAGVHQALRGHPSVAFSEFSPGAAPGSLVKGFRHEDLTRLTYPDACFQLVIHSETLEHVPELDLALAELRRVLRPGGVTVFTAPVNPSVPCTFSRASIRSDGSLQPLVEPLISHPGGDWGYPVFHELGTDFADHLRAVGLEVAVHFGPVRDTDLAQVYVARRPT